MNHAVGSLRSLIRLMAFLPTLCGAQPPGSLEGLISSALQGHPTIQTQQAKVQSASAGLDSANWQFFPTPSVAVEKASAGSSDPAYAGNSTVSTLRLQQPLWTGGRLTAGKEKANAALLVSQTALEEARQQVALRVLQAYSDWLAAYLKVQANEKSLATHRRLQAQVQRRIEQGASAESDLVLAVGRLNSVAAEISLVQAQKQVALARLGQLVAQPIDESSLVALLAPVRPVAAEPQALLELAVAASPTVKRAQAQAQVLASTIAERRADLSPELYVRAERQHGSQALGGASSESRLFIGLSSRFGAGLSSQSAVEGAKAEHQAALLEVEAQRRTVSEQVLADHALATSSQGRLEALKASLKAAGQVADSFDRQFLSGRKTWLDVMNAARELAQTEVQLADIGASQVVVTWRLDLYCHGLGPLLGTAP
jgi:adhesin transport system outer membrane protein